MMRRLRVCAARLRVTRGKTPRGARGAARVCMFAGPARRLRSSKRPQRRKILVVHPSSDLYGSDRMVLESVCALLNADWNVTVALPEFGPLVEILGERGATVVKCPMPVLRKSAFRPLGACKLIRDAVAGVCPALRLLKSTDRVYVNTITIPSWIVFARLMGRSVVCHVHEAERSASPALRRVLFLPVTLAGLVIVNSKFTRTVLQEVAPRTAARSVVVYNGVRGPTMVSPPRTQVSGVLKILYIGRLSPRKGAHIALQALRELRASGLLARLDLLGGVYPGYEWYETELRDCVGECELEDAVGFLGFQPDIWSVIAACDVVVVPSVLEESFGNTAIEAVLSGRALVVSASSGLLEAVSGFQSVQSVTPGDARALAGAIEGVAREWERFSQRAMEDAVEARRRFAPERYRDEIARLVTD